MNLSMQEIISSLLYGIHGMVCNALSSICSIVFCCALCCLLQECSDEILSLNEPKLIISIYGASQLASQFAN